MTSRPRKDRQAPDSSLLCMTRRILICSARVIFIRYHQVIFVRPPSPLPSHHLGHHVLADVLFSMFVARVFDIESLSLTGSGILLTRWAGMGSPFGLSD